MNQTHFVEGEIPTFRKKDFDIRTLQDEIRADALCERFLRLFREHLVEREGRSPEEAGALAHGADYFLREFVISARRENILEIPPKRVRQFAGNWYIVKTLEPNMVGLGQILQGTEAFYAYCRDIDKVSPETAEGVREECAKRDYYQNRIDRFWKIEGDGFLAWEQECPLKE